MGWTFFRAGLPDPVCGRPERKALEFLAVCDPASLGLKPMMHLYPFLNLHVGGNLTRHKKFLGTAITSRLIHSRQQLGAWLDQALAATVCGTFSFSMAAFRTLISRTPSWRMA